MTWTYDTTLSTDLAKVRLLIGDTDTDNQLYSDEEIEGALDLFGNIYMAAAALADGLSARFAQSNSITVDGLQVSSGDMANAYAALAKRLRALAASAPGALGTPFVGGISKSEIESVEDDTDRIESRFKVGKDDFPGTTNASTEETT